MPKKCEGCRHFKPAEGGQFTDGRCDSLDVSNTRPYWKRRGPVLITIAREICDKEGDGIFVHFEPKTPAAGRAFAKACAASFTIAEDLFYPHTEIEGYREGDNDDFLRGDV